MNFGLNVETGLTALFVLGVSYAMYRRMHRQSDNNDHQETLKMDELEPATSSPSGPRHSSTPTKTMLFPTSKPPEKDPDTFSPYLQRHFRMNQRSVLDSSLDHLCVDYWGTTWKMYLENRRSYVFHSPAQKGEVIRVALPLLIYLHGAKGSAWKSAVEETSFRKRSRSVGFYIAYPQGVRFSDSNTSLEHGLTWHYSKDKFDQDCKFIEQVVEDAASKYKIDRSRIFICGYCDGGMFATAMAIKSKLPKAVCTMWGGLDPAEDAITPSADDPDKKPIFILSGGEDAHAKSSQYCHKRFQEAQYDSKITILPDSKYHSYNPIVEPAVLSFFNLK